MSSRFVLGKEFRRLPVALTADDRNQVACEITQAGIALVEGEAGLKEQVQLLRGDLSKKRAKLRGLQEVWTKGEVQMDVACDRVLDLARDVVEWVRTDTGEVIATRTATDDDRQQQFAFSGRLN